MTDIQPPWESELEAARAAIRSGNDGRARVCCRRAAGLIVDEYNRRFPLRAIPGATALDKIKSIAASGNIPYPVRQAAHRLTVNIRDRLKPDFSFLPVNDSMVIIRYFADQLLK